MTFDPMSVEVTCVTLPKDHCVQVPWQYINVCGYSDQFCKIPHTYYILHTYYIHTTYILHTYYVHTTYILRTYYVQNEWSHRLLLNSVQARQKCHNARHDWRKGRLRSRWIDQTRSAMGPSLSTWLLCSCWISSWRHIYEVTSCQPWEELIPTNHCSSDSRSFAEEATVSCIYRFCLTCFISIVLSYFVF